MSRAHAAVVALVLAATPAPAESPSPLRKDLLGRLPPELIADPEDWLAGPAASLKDLRGRVVWLQFNF